MWAQCKAEPLKTAFSWLWVEEAVIQMQQTRTSGRAEEEGRGIQSVERTQPTTARWGYMESMKRNVG